MSRNWKLALARMKLSLQRKYRYYNLLTSQHWEYTYMASTLLSSVSGDIWMEQLLKAEEEAGCIESQALLLRGITAAKAGDRTSARAYLLEASSQDPGREATWLWRSQVAESPTEARECLERALDLNAGNEETRNKLREALVREGVAFAQGGDRQGAARVLSRVTEEDPQNELAWHWRAFAADSDEERVRCMERVLAINPSNERAKAWFARLRLPASQPPGKIESEAEKGKKACPICERTMEPSSERCSSCGSVVSWKNPTALLSGAASDPRTVRAAIHRLVRVEGGEKDAMVQAHLAIAHLNLAQFPRALIRLQAAKVLGLQTPGLDETLTQVKRKIDEVAASTGPLPPVAALARDSVRAPATASPGVLPGDHPDRRRQRDRAKGVTVTETAERHLREAQRGG